jgi:hypothetical protein
MWLRPIYTQTKQQGQTAQGHRGHKADIAGGHGTPRIRTNMQRSAYNVMRAHGLPITVHLYERGLWEVQVGGNTAVLPGQ